MGKKNRKVERKKSRSLTPRKFSNSSRGKEDDINEDSNTKFIRLTPLEASKLMQTRLQEKGEVLPPFSPPPLEGLGSEDKVFLLLSKRDKMASTDGASDSNNSGHLYVSQQDKGGKNKRKLVDHPQQNLLGHRSSLTEFPPYDSCSDKSQMHLDAGSSQPDDWDDPLACQLEGLLLSTIHTIFQNAITLLVRRGYSEDIAQNAISRLGFYHGGTDIVENVVNDAMSFLNSEKNNSRDMVFENLQQMVEYTMVELVNVLMQVEPSLSSGEAMWRLLICDMNISQACAMAEDQSREFSGKEISGENASSSSQSSCKSQFSELPLSASKSNTAKSSLPHDSYMHETLKFGSFPNSPNLKSPHTPEKKTTVSIPESFEKSPMSQAFSFEEKLKKGRKSLNKKELATLQKTLSAERFLRIRSKSISESGKSAGVGNIKLEKKMKSPSKSLGPQTKGSALKMKVKVEASAVSGTYQVPGNAPPVVFPSDRSSEKQIKEPISASAASKIEVATNVFPDISDYYAEIPYDESLGKHVPRDERDKLILKLVPQVQELQNGIEGWTHWANQKVMQATSRLSKDKLELKALKQEKEEAEKCKKEKKILEENAMKRQSEMEYALAKATSQVEATSSTIQKLEVQRSLLMKEMEVQKLQAAQSTASCQEALQREQKAQKDVQLIKGQKSLLEEELKSHRQQVVELQKEKTKAEKVLNQIEGKWNQEKQLREALIAQFASIRFEREKLEAAGKIEEEKLRRKAESDAKKQIEGIKKFEKQLAELRLKSNASRIASLKRGMDGSYGKSDNPSMKGGEDQNDIPQKAVKDLRRERECVMCLSEEKSVVFLPCAHQVLCVNCSELHEKNGMEDCPSCRTRIQQRIIARLVHQ